MPEYLITKREPCTKCPKRTERQIQQGIHLYCEHCKCRTYIETQVPLIDVLRAVVTETTISVNGQQPYTFGTTPFAGAKIGEVGNG